MATMQLQKFMDRIGFKNQQELAEALGVTQAAVSGWNTGSRTPPYETCATLLKMGMTIEELFGEEVALVYASKHVTAEKPSENEIMLMVKKALSKLANS